MLTDDRLTALVQHIATDDPLGAGRAGTEGITTGNAVTVANPFSLASRRGLPGGMGEVIAGEDRRCRPVAQKSAGYSHTRHHCMAVPARRTVPIGKLGNGVDQIR